VEVPDGLVDGPRIGIPTIIRPGSHHFETDRGRCCACRAALGASALVIEALGAQQRDGSTTASMRCAPVAQRRACMAGCPGSHTACPRRRSSGGRADSARVQLGQRHRLVVEAARRLRELGRRLAMSHTFHGSSGSSLAWTRARVDLPAARSALSARSRPTSWTSSLFTAARTAYCSRTLEASREVSCDLPVRVRGVDRTLSDTGVAIGSPACSVPRRPAWTVARALRSASHREGRVQQREQPVHIFTSSGRSCPR